MSEAVAMGRIAAILGYACEQADQTNLANQWAGCPVTMVAVWQRKPIQAVFKGSKYLDNRMMDATNDLTDWPETIMTCNGQFWLTYYRERAAIENTAALKRIRTNSGLNQHEFAKALGMSREMIANIETGKRNPDKAMVDTAKKLFTKPKS